MTLEQLDTRYLNAPLPQILNGIPGVSTQTSADDPGVADSALFKIDAKTGALAFKATPDFESPRDHGRNNVYDVTVTATDADGAADNQNVRITIGDVKGKTLNGTSGADKLNGTVERDIINGKSGHDALNGGAGADDLYGGSGKDVFIFRSIKDSTTIAAGRDTIFDFDDKGGDRIDLRALDANTATKADNAFAFIGTGAFSKTAGELRYEKKASDTFIYGDVNGDGKADFAIHIDDALSLTKGYFLF